MFGKTSNSKYGNIEVIVDNIRFKSKKESQRYLQLKFLQKAGEIGSLQLQVPFVLLNKFAYHGIMERGVTYIADFTYIDYKTRKLVVEDVKGRRTDVYKLKRKFLLSQNPGMDFREI